MSQRHRIESLKTTSTSSSSVTQTIDSGGCDSRHRQGKNLISLLYSYVAYNLDKVLFWDWESLELLDVIHRILETIFLRANWLLQLCFQSRRLFRSASNIVQPSSHYNNNNYGTKCHLSCSNSITVVKSKSLCH